MCWSLIRMTQYELIPLIRKAIAKGNSGYSAHSQKCLFTSFSESYIEFLKMVGIVSTINSKIIALFTFSRFVFIIEQKTMQKYLKISVLIGRLFKRTNNRLSDLFCFRTNWIFQFPFFIDFNLLIIVDRDRWKHNE